MPYITFAVCANFAVALHMLFAYLMPLLLFAFLRFCFIFAVHANEVPSSSYQRIGFGLHFKFAVKSSNHLIACQ